MERTPRLRTLPSRISNERNKSTERNTNKSKSPSRAKDKNKSPSRRSRSRSSGRKKGPPHRYNDEDFETITRIKSKLSVPNPPSPAQSKSASPLKPVVEPPKSIVEQRSNSKQDSRSVSKVKEESRSMSKLKEESNATSKFKEESNATSKLKEESRSSSKSKEESRSPSKLKELREFLTEKLERIRDSVSPEKINDLVRRSISHFEESRDEALRSSFPKTSSPGVSTRSFTLRHRYVENNVAGVKTVQGMEYREEENITGNHVGEILEESKRRSTRMEHVVDKYSLVHIFLYLFFGAFMSLALLVLRVICTKDDCRLLLPKLDKVLDFSLYFDPYVWPIYTLSVALLYAASHICDARLKRTYISYVGAVSMVLLCSAGYACHRYYDGLRHANPLQFLAATIFHMFFINMLAANFAKFFVNLDAFVTKLSSLLTLLLVGNIAAIESSRDFANLNLYIALVPPTLLAFHSLTMQSLPSKAGPLALLYTALTPFIFTLPHVSISANKFELNTWIVGGATGVCILAWIFLAYCQWMKLNYLINPYTHNNIKNCTSSGMFTGGMWKTVRHPDISWRVVCEISIAAATYASPISYAIPVVSILAAVLNASSCDKLANPSYKRTVKYSLFPYIY